MKLISKAAQATATPRSSPFGTPTRRSAIGHRRVHSSLESKVVHAAASTKIPALSGPPLALVPGNFDSPLVLTISPEMAMLAAQRRITGIAQHHAQDGDLYEASFNYDAAAVNALAPDSVWGSSETDSSGEGKDDAQDRDNPANDRKGARVAEKQNAQTIVRGAAMKTRHLTDLGRFTQGRLAELLAWVWFDRIMLFMIFASCVFLALDAPDLDPQSPMQSAQVGNAIVAPTPPLHPIPWVRCGP
jgi:hypothetical protein